MISKVISGAVHGVDGYTVTAEVDLSPGIPGIEIVGLPDSAVKESKERIRSAIKNTGHKIPLTKIIINLAPANTKKAGASFDLPMAVGILCGAGLIPRERLSEVFITGELSLDGYIKPVNGILSMIDNASRSNFDTCIVPYNNAQEAGLIQNVKVIAVKTLKEVIDYFIRGIIPEYPIDAFENNNTPEEDAGLDFCDVKGQENVKRALEIAAAGYHNVLMIGPPGSGKTMLAKRVPTILNDLTFQESLEVTKIYSVAGRTIDMSNPKRPALIKKRPFRSPHHTVSDAALVGGGTNPKPGEISFSHNGVLFLDEFPEFRKNVREVLRQPLEEGFVTISRANGTVVYPSRFMLIASMNPCPCGFYPNQDKCSCSNFEVSKYLNRISGPLLDRIDIQTEVYSIDYDKISSVKKPENSKAIKLRVEKALSVQTDRFKGHNIRYNSQLTTHLIEKYCQLNDSSKKMLKQAFEIMGLSARAYHKILKVARTIADLDGCENILDKHIAEAIQYRGLDRKYWS